MPSAEYPLSLEHVRREAEAVGLAWRGAFHPQPEDAVPPFDDGGSVRTVVLLGSIGHRQWADFVSSPEYADGAADPLDRWSRRVIDTLATACDGLGLFPSQGPPWMPFQRWARRAEPLHPSPLGLLIHPEYGLWHAYRGALGLRPRLGRPAPPDNPSPCDSCSAKPCLSACPVQAFSVSGYDRSRCVGHVGSASGSECFSDNCRARHACPVGAQHRYTREQSEFHMRAFLGMPRAARSRSSPSMIPER